MFVYDMNIPRMAATSSVGSGRDHCILADGQQLAVWRIGTGVWEPFE